MSSELLLTEKEHTNYVALVRLIRDEPLSDRRSNKRPGHEKMGLRQKLSNLLRQGCRCPRCGHEYVDEVNGPRYPTNEHVIPYQYGGTLSDLNNVLICMKCNQKGINQSVEKTIRNVAHHYGRIDLGLIHDYVIGSDEWDESFLPSNTSPTCSPTSRDVRSSSSQSETATP